jgi:hypothetical protein
MTHPFDLPVCLTRHAGLATRLYRVLATTSAQWLKPLPHTPALDHDEPQNARRCSSLLLRTTQSAASRLSF